MYDYLLPNIIYGGYSDKGIRSENQDSFRININNTLATFLVADGVGGYSFGGRCSKGVSESIINELENVENKPIEYIKGLLEKKYSQVNEYIYYQGRANDLVMATTIATINIVDDRCLISNIGDTKIFLIRKNEIKLISEEHTVAYELFKSKKISYEEFLNHDKRRILSKAIGATKTVNAYYNILEMEDDDIFLILSDGVYNFLSDVDFLKITRRFLEEKTKDLNELCREIVKQAIENKSNDNATAVAVYVINS